MGTVFQARRKSDGLEVAIKVLRPSLSRNARFVERMRREAEISMRLDHPGLVKGYGFGEEGGYHYVVMESCAGRTLAALLKAWGSFPEERVLDLGIQLAEALACAHDGGVIHRDVKPSNIVVDDDGRAKLMDLGLAKAESDPTLTRDGGTVGTPQYMSPEQAEAPTQVDERSDLYSLGATLYHMVVGSPPFEGDSAAQVLTRLLGERVVPASQVEPSVSRGLDLVLRRLLMRRPEDRYASARELVADLRAVQKGRAPSIDERQLSRAEDGGLAAQSRRRRWVAVGSIGVALGVLVTLLFWWTRNDGEPAKIDGLDKLVQVVRDDQRDYRTRFELLAAFEPKDAGVAFEITALRQQLLRDFDAAMSKFHEAYTRERLASWVHTHGIGPNLEAEFERQQELDLQRHFPGYRSDTLPSEIRGMHEDRVARERRMLRQLHDEKVDDVALRARQTYESRVEPTVAQLVARRDFGAAVEELDGYLEHPASLAMLEGDETALRDLSDPRFDTIARSMETRRAEVVNAARRMLADRRRDVDGALEDARRSRQAGFPERAQRMLVAQRRRLDMEPPWVSLPPQVTADTDDLRQRLEREQGAIQDELQRLDLETLALAEDAVHARLSRDLAVGEAKALLDSYRVSTEDGRAVRDALGRDLERMQRLLVELPRLMFDADRLDYAPVELHEGRVDVVIEKVFPGPPPEFSMRSRDGVIRRVRVQDFDPAWMARRIEGTPGFDEERRIGLGMLLYVLDDFDLAFRELRSHRLQRLLAARERREALLARGARGDEARAERLLSRVRELAGRPGEFPAASIGPMLEDLEARFRATAVVTGARDELSKLHEFVRAERARRQLLVSMPEVLRHDVDVAWLEPESSDEVGSALRVVLPFDVRGRFENGLPPWKKLSLGLIPPSSDGRAPRDELAAPLEVDLPILGTADATTVVLRVHVPGGARPLEVLELELFGSRLLVAGVFPDGARLVPNPPKDIKKALARACKLEARPWAFVAGLEFEIRVELAACEGLARSAEVRIPGLDDLSLRLDVPTVADTKLRIAATGSIVLRSIEILGRLR